MPEKAGIQTANNFFTILWIGNLCAAVVSLYSIWRQAKYPGINVPLLCAILRDVNTILAHGWFYWPCVKSSTPRFLIGV